MVRKKVILFIVEGISDQESLELLLTELIPDDSQIIFKVVGGDMTTNRSINVSNIKAKLTNVIKGRGKRKFKPSDYQEVIHLVDMDGAFVPEESIYEDRSANGFIYKDDGIYAKDVTNVMIRNATKQEVLNLLVSITKVFDAIPYRVFYFSCNLEHVLHGQRQVEDRTKVKRAEAFQDRYIEDLQGFVDLMCKSGFSVKKSYKESWEFIKQGTNSVNRFSNFNILLEEYLKMVTK